MRRLARQTGFSLVEVLSAIGLFSIIALGLSTSTISNMQLNSRSKTIAAANALLQNKIEQIRLLQPVLYGDPNLIGLMIGQTYPNSTYPDTPNPIDEFGNTGTGGTFTRQWTVSGVPQYYNGTQVGIRPGIVEVVVTVSWTSRFPGSVSDVTYACISPTCG